MCDACVCDHHCTVPHSTSGRNPDFGAAFPLFVLNEAGSAALEGAEGTARLLLEAGNGLLSGIEEVLGSNGKSAAALSGVHDAVRQQAHAMGLPQLASAISDRMAYCSGLKSAGTDGATDDATDGATDGVTDGFHDASEATMGMSALAGNAVESHQGVCACSSMHRTR